MLIPLADAHFVHSILTKTLAEKVNAIARLLPNTVRLKDLVQPGNTAVAEWHKFLWTLAPDQRQALLAALHYSLTSMETIGDCRAAFLLTAFQIYDV